MVMDCTADAGTLTADMDKVTLADGEAMISAIPAVTSTYRTGTASCSY